MFFWTPHDRECTVVLLGSERIDAVMGEGFDTRHDLKNFTKILLMVERYAEEGGSP